jgi:hypothetical protein
MARTGMTASREATLQTAARAARAAPEIPVEAVVVAADPAWFKPQAEPADAEETETPRVAAAVAAAAVEPGAVLM